MDNNDFCYILMSSLKHPYREYTTKEATSLLMKELDQAASSVVHHFGRGNQQSAADSSTACVTHSNNHRHHFNNHQRRLDGLSFGSPKSPENVARTILRALGASSEDRDTPTGSANRRRSVSSAVQLTNGQHHYQKHTSQQASSSSVLTRCRRKLHLQFTRHGDTESGSPSPLGNQQLAQLKAGKSTLSSSNRQAVVLATNGDTCQEQDSSFSPSDDGVTPSLPPSAHHFVTWPLKPLSVPTAIAASSPGLATAGRDSILAKDRRKSLAYPECVGLEEHQLIARHSSILMVKPTGGPGSSRHLPGDQESAEGSSDSSPDDSFAAPPPPANVNDPETAILDSDTSQSQHSDKHRYFVKQEPQVSRTNSGHVLLSSVEHHPPPSASFSQQLQEETRPRDTVTPSGTISSTEPEPSPEPSQQHAVAGLAASAAHADSRSITGGSLQRIHNRLCTSYRLKVPAMKNPVDVCLLPNDDMAIADYDNGLLIVNDLGEIIEHKKTYREVNACGVDCIRGGSCSPAFRIFLLVVRDGAWTINVYRNFDLIETARCPTDAQIENWALRRLVVCVDSRLHLLASGETKSTIWTYEFDRAEWRVLLTEHSGGRKATSGNYNDMSVKYNKDTKQTRIVLCEWKKAQLWTLFLNEKTDVMEEKSIKMKRVKGQEWIVQGPHLALLDEQADILVYDGSGKLFLFDGDTYRCKKIVADLGKGEVSALTVADGWIYALCRYKRCIEAFMYKEHPETHI